VRRLYAGVFLVSASVLILQIALTRLFSFTIWYHFAYVTISVALLGYGASGAFVSVFPRLAGDGPARSLPVYALASGLSILLALMTFAYVPFHPFQLRAEAATQIPLMIVFYGAVMMPFFFAGLCVSIALKTLSDRVSRLYFADLLGAGVGCAVVILAIEKLTTPGAVVAAAVAVSLAGALFAASGDGRRFLLALGGAVAIAVVGPVIVSTLRFLPSPEKFLYPFITGGTEKGIVDYGHRWTAIFRTDVFGFTDEDFWRRASYASWGISPYWREQALSESPRIRIISHDGDACAVIYNFDGDLSKLQMFDHHILKAPYVLLDRPRVLVIGVGGGTDIVNAVKNGAQHVTGIELDPATVETVRRDQADFAGHLYDRADVTVTAGEGRSTLRHSNERYDLIELTGVDTLAALSTGAYVLSESYLYTVEAIQEFLDHLAPGGLLSIIVADYPGGVFGFPRHSMRQLSLFVAALRERGIEDARSRIAVLASHDGQPQVALLLKNAPFTPEEGQRLGEFADRLGFHIWALPDKRLSTVQSQFLSMTATEQERFLAEAPLWLTPTTDDNPFFFSFYRWRSLHQSLNDVDVGHSLATGQITLSLILVFSVVFSTLFILLPLFVFQRRGLAVRGRWGFVAYFVGLGLGFIMLEISFIQKFVLFLGYPTYSLTVVLFSLLTFSGIGSALTARMRTRPEQRLAFLFAALATVSIAYTLGLPLLFHVFLGSSFAARAMLSSLVLLPLGLVLGMFFPSGIQLVRLANENFVPWAWGINGCASVVGTVLAVVLAMALGFRMVTFISLGIYAVGVLGMRFGARAITE
jgi:SAM-dependent methyltransferase